MTVQFDNRHYTFAHGRAPRGYGCWAFFFSTDEDQPWRATAAEPWFVARSMSFAEAKAAARKEARARGARTVFTAS